MAHRDIKLKNILVREDLTCVIADLGLAAKYEKGYIDMPVNRKSGTVVSHLMGYCIFSLHPWFFFSIFHQRTCHHYPILISERE